MSKYAWAEAILDEFSFVHERELSRGDRWTSAKLPFKLDVWQNGRWGIAKEGHYDKGITSLVDYLEPYRDYKKPKTAGRQYVSLLDDTICVGLITKDSVTEIHMVGTKDLAQLTMAMRVENCRHNWAKNGVSFAVARI